MKHTLYTLLLALAMLTAACGDDKKNEPYIIHNGYTSITTDDTQPGFDFYISPESNDCEIAISNLKYQLDVPRVISNVYELSSETHYEFNVNPENNICQIMLYNVQFSIGDQISPKMNIRIDVPYTFSNGIYKIDQNTEVIIPFLLRGESFVPADQFPVTDFHAVVNIGKDTFSFSFNCHGGSYNDNGTTEKVDKDFYNRQLFIFGSYTKTNGIYNFEPKSEVIIPCYYSKDVQYSSEGAHNNSSYVPVNLYTLTDFHTAINSVNMTYSVSFNCHGNRYSFSGKVQ